MWVKRQFTEANQHTSPLVSVRLLALLLFSLRGGQRQCEDSVCSDEKRGHGQECSQQPETILNKRDRQHDLINTHIHEETSDHRRHSNAQLRQTPANARNLQPRPRPSRDGLRMRVHASGGNVGGLGGAGGAPPTTASSKLASRFSAETSVVLSASSIAWWIAVWYSGRRQPHRKTRAASGSSGSTPSASRYLHTYRTSEVQMRRQQRQWRL